MRRFRYIALLFLAAWAPAAQAAGSEELVYGVSNEVLLLLVLGMGILVLFVSILTLAYMLYGALPAVLKQRFKDEQGS